MSGLESCPAALWGLRLGPLSGAHSTTMGMGGPLAREMQGGISGTALPPLTAPWAPPHACPFPAVVGGSSYKSPLHGPGRLLWAGLQGNPNNGAVCV